MTPEGQADWYDAWLEAWYALDAQGVTSALGGRQYMRLTARALAARVEPCQAAMRAWILAELGAQPGETVTEESLARRAKRRAENERKANDGD